MGTESRRCVLLCAGGSRGDVEPLLNVARALLKRDLDVRLLCHEEYSSLASDSRVEWRPLAGGGSRSREAGDITDGEEADKMWRDQLEDLESAAKGVDCIVFNWFTVYAVHLAEKMGVPAVAVWLAPFTRTSEYPCFFFHNPSLLQGKSGTSQSLATPHNNYRSYLLQEYICWKPFERQINVWRKRLGLKPAPIQGHFVSMLQNHTLTLCGWSPAVVPPSSDWNKHTFICGYFQNPSPMEDDLLPAELEEFLRRGPPPVYIGLGSTRPRKESVILERLVNSALALNLRVVLCHRSVPFEIHPQRVITIKQAAHESLFKRCSLIVHHGGAGTTGKALVSGVPQMICPVEFDQFFWADRVQTLEIGKRCLQASKIASETEFDYIQTNMKACLDPAMVSRARSLATILKKEIPGSIVAAQFVVTYMDQWMDRKR